MAVPEPCDVEDESPLPLTLASNTKHGTVWYLCLAQGDRRNGEMKLTPPAASELRFFKQMMHEPISAKSKARPIRFSVSRHKQNLQDVIELVIDEGRRPYAVLQGRADGVGVCVGLRETRLRHSSEAVETET